MKASEIEQAAQLITARETVEFLIATATLSIDGAPLAHSFRVFVGDIPVGGVLLKALHAELLAGLRARKGEIDAELLELGVDIG